MKSQNLSKKSLGHCFLFDKNIVKKIVEIGNINKSKTVFEIGPGYGSLTDIIHTKSPKNIVTIEKDEKLFSFLIKKYKDKKNIKIVNDDILNFLNKKIFEKKVIVFGNLPYNISTQILANLILIEKWPPWYDKLILMFQKEVADRIIAKSKTKNFSRISILSNWRLKVKKHFDISNNCFYPKPKVTSTLLSFEPMKNDKFHLRNPKNLELVTRELFQNRRKMINKSLNKLFKNDVSVIKMLNIDLRKRPEEFNSEVFYKIAIQYEKLFD